MHISVSLWSQNRFKSLKALVQLKYSSGGLMSHCSYDVADMPAIISQQNSSLSPAQKTDMLTAHLDRTGTMFWLK